MNPLRNEKGQYVLGAAILAGIITFILVLTSQSKLSTTLQTRSKEKAALDAQMAIDQFAMELKKSIRSRGTRTRKQQCSGLCENQSGAHFRRFSPSNRGLLYTEHLFSEWHQRNLRPPK